MANSNKDGLAGSIAGELHIGVQGPPGPVGPQGPVGPVGPEATPLTVTISGTAASHSASEIIAAIKAEKIVEVNMGTERLQVTAWDESAVTVTCKKAPAPNRSGALLSCNEYTISDDKTVTIVANSAISNNFTAKAGQVVAVANADPSGPTDFKAIDVREEFIATYGTTTFAEIYDAMSANKAVYCKNGNVTLPMTACIAQSLVAEFGGATESGSVVWKVKSATWSSYNAEASCGDCVKTVNGIAPDENGNVVVSGGGLNATASGLLIKILRGGVYSEDQSDNITALAAELGVTEEEQPDTPVEPDEPDTPEVTLSSISATYSGGDVAVGTAVTDLTGIVVTAEYSDGSSEAVTGYTLSGEIAEGSNTITVTYEGMTATFTVTGVAEEPEVVTYTITNTLTNVTNSNSVASVEENTSYSATLTADDGYELDSVTVTMGGTDITATAYASGVVTIGSVTGNVVITAVAVEVQQPGLVMVAGENTIPAYSLINYTDNGATLNPNAVSDDINTYLWSAEPFEANTRVKVTITPTSTAQSYVSCKAAATKWDGESEIVPNNKVEVFYQASLLGKWITGGTVNTAEYTVPAGCRLILWYGSCTVTVEEIGVDDSVSAPIETIDMLAPVQTTTADNQTWYSDDGTTSFGNGAADSLIASEEVFPEDTTVVVTLCLSGSSNIYDHVRVASETSWDGLSEPSADNPVIAHYTEYADSVQGWGTTQTRRQYTYEVRAGSRLLIYSSTWVAGAPGELFDQLASNIKVRKQEVE